MSKINKINCKKLNSTQKRKIDIILFFFFFRKCEWKRTSYCIQKAIVDADSDIGGDAQEDSRSPSLFESAEFSESDDRRKSFRDLGTDFDARRRK